MPSPTEALHPDFVQRVPELAAAFPTAAPFPHVVIEGLLAPPLLDAVVAGFPDFERGRHANELGHASGKATNTDVRALGPAYEALDDLLRSRAFLDRIETITGIPGLRHDPAYFGGGTHENLPGQELDPHVDFNRHPVDGTHRRLNLILYLDDWEPAWGGGLELHSDPWQPASSEVVTITPRRNRAVLFETSERSWHGFSKVTLPADACPRSRRSFALYLYTETRPADEIVPPHATVYVSRDAPAAFRAGEPLTLAAAQGTVEAFERHLQMVRFLQERETQLVERVRSAIERTCADLGEPLAAEHEAATRWLLEKHREMQRFLYAREVEFSAKLAELEALPPRREHG